MSVTISQSLPIPSGLANGQIADAGQITPLYNSLNAFVIPTRYVPFQQNMSDNTNTVLTIGGTVTVDYVLTVPIPANSAFSYIFAFDTAGNTGLDQAVTLRKNGIAITDPISIVPAVGPFSSSIMAWFPPVQQSAGGMVGIISHGSTGEPVLFTENTGYSSAITTSLGFTLTGTAGTLSTDSFRAWSEP